jgi:hypothetical protein
MWRTWMLKVVAVRLLAALMPVAAVVLLVAGGGEAVPPGVSWT